MTYLKGCAVVLLLASAATARADSFTFDFSGQDVSGSGSFLTDPLVMYPGGGYELTSLNGEMNGQSMELVYGALNYEDAFEGTVGDGTGDLVFTVGGVEYAIFEPDMGPDIGYQLWLGGLDADLPTPITFSVADPVPTDTPESGTLLLCVLGMLTVFSRRIRNLNARGE